jgi:predicted amino acid dehydrogenase
VCDQILKRIVSISLGSSLRDFEFEHEFAGQRYHVQRIGTDGDKFRALSLIKELDGNVDAIGLGGMDVTFFIGKDVYTHQDTLRFVQAAKKTPVVDGVGLKHTLERWVIKHIAREYPDLFTNKKALIMSGVDRYGLAEVLSEHVRRITFGDLPFHLNLNIPIRSLKGIRRLSRIMLPIITNIPFEFVYPTGRRQHIRRPVYNKLFQRNDIIVGDFPLIRRYAPEDLSGKSIITDALSGEDLAELKERGVETVITTTPEIHGRSLATNLVEAMFVAHLGYTKSPQDTPGRMPHETLKDEYMNLILESGIKPRAISLSEQPVEAVNKFAFIIHPVTVQDYFRDRRFSWLRLLPGRFVEWLVSKKKWLYVNRIRGVHSADGTHVQGYMYAITFTPRQIVKYKPETIYAALSECCEAASRRGASLIGLGAFTSVAGDAGVTVAKHSPIPVTTGNSYTVSATLDAIRLASEKMGIDISKSTACVIGATGAIGKPLSRLLARDVAEMILVSPRPERLMDLSNIIEQETGLKTELATSVDEVLGKADIVVASTSVPGGIVDVMKLKRGALVVDVAMPPDVSRTEAAKRDDVLVMESGEILLPTNPGEKVDFGVHFDLPDNVAYACLAETILLALEGKFESFTLGREMDIEKVEEIGEIGRKHGFKLCGIRSFGRILTDEEIETIRENAGR